MATDPTHAFTSVVDLLKPRKAVLTGLQLGLLYEAIHEQILGLVQELNKGELTNEDALKHCYLEELQNLRDYLAELQGPDSQ
jgi:hypothetical protein